MTWVRIDDGYFRNAKTRSVGVHGRALHLASICWAGSNLTDGAIPRAVLGLLASEADVKPAVHQTLVAAGLWTVTDDGWQINDYLAYNPSADKVKAERHAATERQRRSREAAMSRRDKTVSHANVTPLVTVPTTDRRQTDDTTRHDSSNSHCDDDSESSAAPSSSVDQVLELVVAGLAHQAFKTSHGGWRAATLRNQRTENADAIAAALEAGDTPLEIAARYADPVHIRLATNGADQ